MRFLLLLLPNLYDIFTVIMIGYAFILNQKGELQIPFIAACGLIYLATRLGIFAGELLHMILGQPQTDVSEEEGAEPNAKRLLWNFGPQAMFVVIFQVIMLLCCLPHSGSAIAKQPIPKEDLKQEQVQVQDNEIAASDTQTAEEKKLADEEFFGPADEETTPQAAATPSASEQKPQTVAKTQTTRVAVRRTPAASKAKRVSANNNNASYEQPVAVQNDNRYFVPERTLQTVGVSASSQYINNTARANQIAATNGTYDNTSSSPSGSLTPKRYPGDDNPINTTWGYYRQTPQQQRQSVQQANSASTKNAGSSVPNNTLKTIGY